MKRFSLLLPTVAMVVMAMSCQKSSTPVMPEDTAEQIISENRVSEDPLQDPFGIDEIYELKDALRQQYDAEESPITKILSDFIELITGDNAVGDHFESWTTFTGLGKDKERIILAYNLIGELDYYVGNRTGINEDSHILVSGSGYTTVVLPLSTNGFIAASTGFGFYFNECFDRAAVQFEEPVYKAGRSIVLTWSDGHATINKIVASISLDSESDSIPTGGLIYGQCNSPYEFNPTDFDNVLFIESRIFDQEVIKTDYGYQSTFNCPSFGILNSDGGNFSFVSDINTLSNSAEMRFTKYRSSGSIQYYINLNTEDYGKAAEYLRQIRWIWIYILNDNAYYSDGPDTPELKKTYCEQICNGFKDAFQTATITLIGDDFSIGPQGATRTAAKEYTFGLSLTPLSDLLLEYLDVFNTIPSVLEGIDLSQLLGSFKNPNAKGFDIPVPCLEREDLNVVFATDTTSQEYINIKAIIDQVDDDQAKEMAIENLAKAEKIILDFVGAAYSGISGKMPLSRMDKFTLPALYSDKEAFISNYTDIHFRFGDNHWENFYYELWKNDNSYSDDPIRINTYDIFKQAFLGILEPIYKLLDIQK